MSQKPKRFVSRHVEKKVLRAAHRASFKNGDAIRQSTLCRCFYCLKEFPAAEADLISEIDGQQTAWCPYCNIDSVLGDAQPFPFTYAFSKAMRKFWFR